MLSEPLWIKNIDKVSRPLAFLYTKDGYVCARWVTDGHHQVLLQYNRSSQLSQPTGIRQPSQPTGQPTGQPTDSSFSPNNPYIWFAQSNGTLRQSLANVLGLDSMPKVVELDNVVYHEPPVSSHEPVPARDVLECQWSDFARDRIVLTANLTFENSENENQHTFDILRHRQLMYSKMAALEKERNSYVH